jgi:hypothetical protein
MGLFIDLTTGAHQALFDDLLLVVGCDPGLTTTVFDASALQVQYTQKKGATQTSSMVLALVNGAKNVLIVGVNSAFVAPGGTLPITKYTGGVALPGDLTTPITIYIDVTDGGGGGQYYVVHDKDGLDIFEPRPVILCHELAHAYHWEKGDTPATDALNEIQTIADENAFRKQVGLPERHATDHYGTLGVPAHGGVTGIAKCKPEYSGWSPGWKCPMAVATATLGSPEAPQITELRRARQQYRNMSLWAALMAEPALEAYRKFSPHVVRDVLSDPPLRKAMLLYVVQPTVRLLHVAEAYLAAEADTPELAAKLDRLLDEYVLDLAAAGGSAPALRDAADGASTAASALLAADGRSPAGPADRQLPRALYPYIAGAIGANDGKATFAWAFAGLALFLRQAAARLADGAGVGPEFLRSLDDWVAQLPMPPDVQLSLSDARRELGALRDRIFTRTAMRERFARHLLARWSQGSAADLEALLRGLGYIASR